MSYRRQRECGTPLLLSVYRRLLLHVIPHHRPAIVIAPPPLPRTDKDGEIVGGSRWLVVVASPEFDGDYEDPISLRASCAIARFCCMILFIAARLPRLPLPLLFGSRFSANDPRCSSSCSALPPTPSSSSTTSELFCEATSTCRRCRSDRRRRKARSLRTCPRDRRSGGAHNDTITARATQGQRMCVLIFLFLLSVRDVLQH